MKTALVFTLVNPRGRRHRRRRRRCCLTAKVYNVVRNCKYKRRVSKSTCDDERQHMHHKD